LTPIRASGYHELSRKNRNEKRNTESTQIMIVVNRQQAAVINTPHGSEIRPLIDRTTSEIELCSLAEEVLPAGAAVGRHHHLETEEVYYLLEGRGRMTVGGETREVAAGDAIFIPRGATHALENTGDAPLRLLLVCGPAYSREDHLMEG
jgi:mannose-6-phosphate isomerase-like protein (cupin superfamily)